MNNEEIRITLIKELGIDELPQEAQDEIVSKLGEIILKSITVAVFETLSEEARQEFDAITTMGDPAKIGEFLSRTVPNMEELMAQEVQNVLKAFREGEQLIAESEQPIGEL